MARKKITAQDIFNAAWQAFIVEGKPPAQAYDQFDNLQCRYLTRDGRKCAVGLCIPDGHPFQKKLGSFPSLLANDRNKPKKERIFDESIHKMECEDQQYLQLGLHDSLTGENGWAVTPEQMRAAYIRVAKKFNLTIPEEITC